MKRNWFVCLLAPLLSYPLLWLPSLSHPVYFSHAVFKLSIHFSLDLLAKHRIVEAKVEKLKQMPVYVDVDHGFLVPATSAKQTAFFSPRAVIIPQHGYVYVPKTENEDRSPRPPRMLGNHSGVWFLLCHFERLGFPKYICIYMYTHIHSHTYIYIYNMLYIHTYIYMYNIYMHISAFATSLTNIHIYTLINIQHIHQIA